MEWKFFNLQYFTPTEVDSKKRYAGYNCVAQVTLWLLGYSVLSNQNWKSGQNTTQRYKIEFVFVFKVHTHIYPKK